MATHNDWSRQIRIIMKRHTEKFPEWADGFIYDLAECLAGEAALPSAQRTATPSESFGKKYGVKPTAYQTDGLQKHRR